MGCFLLPQGGEGGRVQGLRAVLAEKLPAAGQQKLRRTLEIAGEAPLRHRRRRVFPGGIKGLIAQPAGLDWLPPRQLQKRPVGGVAAGGAVGTPGGGGVQQTAFPGGLPKRRQLPQGLGRQPLSVAQQKPLHRQTAPGEGAGLVGEQKIQAARRFDAGELAHHDAVFLHPQHTAGEHHGDHHGQTLRHGHDDDADGQRCGVEQQLQHRGQMGKLGQHQRGDESVCNDDLVKQVCQRHQQRRAVAQPAHGAGQLAQPELQGAFPRLLLQREGHAAEKGMLAGAQHLHHALSCGNACPAQQQVRACGIPLGGLLRRGRPFADLSALAGKGRLVAMKLAPHQNAVGGDAFSRFQQNQIAHHQLLRRDLLQKRLPPHPAGDPCGLLLQPEKGVFAAGFGER